MNLLKQGFTQSFKKPFVQPHAELLHILLYDSQ